MDANFCDELKLRPDNPELPVEELKSALYPNTKQPVIMWGQKLGGSKILGNGIR